VPDRDDKPTRDGSAGYAIVDPDAVENPYDDSESPASFVA